MTDMPDRIWARLTVRDDDGETEYVRADLLTRLQCPTLSVITFEVEPTWLLLWAWIVARLAGRKIRYRHTFGEELKDE